MMRKAVLPATALLFFALGTPGCEKSPAPAKHGAAHSDHAHAAAAQAFSVAATPLQPLAAGKTSTLSIRLADAAGTALGPAALSTSHEHLLHVMIVDSGLEDYAHLHPEAASDDAFVAAFTPRFPRAYRLWTDFTPTAGAHPAAHGAGHHGPDAVRVATDLVVGKEAAPPLPARVSLVDAANGLRFALALAEPLRAGAATTARLAVTDAAGKPFDRLEPLMGAYAHLVGFSAGAATMLHAHPEGDEPADAAGRGGPTLRFSMTPTAAGPHRLFVQVRADGAVVLARFDVVVAPAQ